MSLCLCSLHRILKPNDLECLISTVRVPLFHSKKPTALSYHMTHNLCVVATRNVCLVMGEPPHSLCWEHPRWGCLQHWELLEADAKQSRDAEQEVLQKVVHPYCHSWRWVAVSNVRGKSSKQLDCLSWSSVLARGQTRFTTFLIYFCFSHLAKKKGFGCTWPSFWRHLCKSLQALWAGVWPDTTMDGLEHPWAGQPLAGGFFAVVYVTRWPRLDGCTLPIEALWIKQTLCFMWLHQYRSRWCSAMDRLPWWALLEGVHLDWPGLPTRTTTESAQRSQYTEIAVAHGKGKSSNPRGHSVQQKSSIAKGFWAGQSSQPQSQEGFFSWLPLCQAFIDNEERVHPLFDPQQTPMGGLSLLQPDWMHCKCPRHRLESGWQCSGFFVHWGFERPPRA